MGEDSRGGGGRHGGSRGVAAAQGKGGEGGSLGQGRSEAWFAAAGEGGGQERDGPEGGTKAEKDRHEPTSEARERCR